MSLSMRLKTIVERLPENVAKPLVYIPFTLRLGKEYWKSSKLISQCERHDSISRDRIRFEQLRELVYFAGKNIPFYRQFYNNNKFNFEMLRSWDDWKRVPIVTKTDLQEISVSDRCAPGVEGIKVNTGGTSGQSLEFYLDRQAFAREWAHMHYVWKSRGYSTRHLKLTFRGKHFDKTRPLRYNAIHNEYIVNSACSMEDVVESVIKLSESTIIRWIHGYPSLVAEFGHAMIQFPTEMKSRFRGRLFGVLLGSEYPAPAYRSVIERELSSNVVSWYGHSEMSVLARETALGIYESFSTYGYAEAVRTENGEGHRLVCTSLHNRLHPFIRYDTGDLIEPVGQHAGSLAFSITEGRVGDFIYDRRGQRHSLTAVIFGRHHRAFELVKHLQVRDDGAGRIVLVVTPRNGFIDEAVLSAGFDLSDLDIDWSLEIVEAPIRTEAGKIRLKIN